MCEWFWQMRLPNMAATELVHLAAFSTHFKYMTLPCIGPRLKHSCLILLLSRLKVHSRDGTQWVTTHTAGFLKGSACCLKSSGVKIFYQAEEAWNIVQRYTIKKKWKIIIPSLKQTDGQWSPKKHAFNRDLRFTLEKSLNFYFAQYFNYSFIQSSWSKSSLFTSIAFSG